MTKRSLLLSASTGMPTSWPIATNASRSHAATSILCPQALLGYNGWLTNLQPRSRPRVDRGAGCRGRNPADPPHSGNEEHGGDAHMTKLRLGGILYQHHLRC